MKWKLVPVEPTPEMIKAGADVECIITGIDEIDAPEDYKRVFMAMLEAAPQPPRLSDERILEVAESEAVLLVERGNFTGRLYVTNSVSSVYALARAIEREILGGTEK